MKKGLLAIILVFLLFGSLIVFLPNVAACHNKTASCSPTEKDITDIDTYMVEYEIDVSLSPGCGNQYWVGFTADPAPNGWSRKVYEKGDPLKQDILGTGTPPDGDHNNWNDFISAGSGSVHFYAILQVKVISPQMVENGDTAVITVHCWSVDNVPNDLEDDPITTTTSLNIPHGIRMYHTVSYDATQWIYPDKWVEYDITIKDIGNASGLVDLSKDVKSQINEDWLWEFSKNSATITQVTLPENSTVSFKLRVKPPATTTFNDYSIFIIKGVSQADPVKYYHTVAAKTIVTVPLPDLSVKSTDMKCLSDDPCDGETIDFSIDVYNLGEIAVSNFDVTFTLTDPGAEADIDSIDITETLEPNKKTNVVFQWKAIEGDHSLCIHADDKSLIMEEDEEGNNEAGILITIGPAKPKNIIVSMELKPSTCMPSTDFEVTGDVKYNPEYGSLPVTDTNVEIKILETGKIFNTKTDKDGKYTKTCTAPDTEGDYTIQITVSKEGITGKASKYLTVASFIIDLSVEPRTVITEKEVKISGRVTEDDYGVTAADVLLEIIDSDESVEIKENLKTDTNGFYTKTIKSPKVEEFTTYTLKATGTKDDITGIKTTVLYVDIDTDLDNIANSVDTDDDNDNYPDTIEVAQLTNPLDFNSKPLPVADAGTDQIVNEGDEVSFDGSGSYKLAGSALTYDWDFGDESESSAMSPKHTYTTDGDYEVTLEVTDSYGGTNEAKITITVNDLGPTAKIVAPTTGETKTKLTFHAKDSTSVIDKITKYEWKFGDGETATGEEVTHEYTKAAESYTVTLIITDSDGSTDEITHSIEITPGKGGSEETGDESDSKTTNANNSAMLIGIVVIIVVVILIALFMMMRKKKPSEQTPETRVAANTSAQDSRRPTTQFAEANIKPAMTAGTVPQRPAVAPQQRAQLPPSQPQQNAKTQPQQQQPGYQTPPQEQRDWSWNFNE